MKNIFASMLMALAPLYATLGAYKINSTHNVFYFEDETVARDTVSYPNLGVVGYDWVDVTRFGLGDLNLKSGESGTYYAVMKSDHKTVKAWGLSKEKNIAKCFRWDENNSTNYTIAYNSQYEGETHYLYVHLRWYRYKLSLSSDGLNLADWPETDICYTNSVSLPTLSKTGYTFNGWTNSVIAVPLKGSITGSTLAVEDDGTNVILSAKWTANSYTVNFDANGGSVSPASRNYTYDALYGSLPTPARAGYSFLGWYTGKESGAQVTASTKVTTAAAHTLYARWKAATYTVTFYNYGSVSAGAGTRAVVYDSNPGPLNMIPSWGSGYSFGGYFTGENGTGVKYWDENGMFVRSAWDIANDVNLYAYKIASEFTVYYDANGAAGEIVQSTGVYGGNVTLSNGSGFSKPYFQFVGWAKDPHAVQVEYAGGEVVRVEALAGSGASKSVVLYAVWKDLRREVRFDYMGGIEGESVRTNLIGNVYGELPVASWTGDKYSFLGWFTERSGGEEVTSETLVPDGVGVITLYARWDAAGFFVEFDGNGEDEDSVQMAAQEFSFDEPQPLSLNQYSKTGYTFAGWATNESSAAMLEAVYQDGQVISNLAETAAASVKLYAVWSTNEYRVVFNPSGGDGVMDEQRFFWDQQQALAANRFTRSATWRFDGWSNIVNGAVYADAEVVSNLTPIAGGVVELHAIWTDLLTKWSRAADCTNLVLECEADKAWSVDDTFGAVGGTSVHAEYTGVKVLNMSVKLPGPGTVTFLVNAAFVSEVGSMQFTKKDELVWSDRIEIKGNSGGWVQYAHTVDAELDVEWRATLADGDRCWVDNIRWYPSKSVSVKDGTQAEIPGEDANVIKSEVLAHWHEIFADASETYSSAVFSVAKDDVGRAAAALKLGFIPTVSRNPADDGSALLTYGLYPEISISAFSATDPAVTLVGVDVSCGNAMPVWADSAARSLRLLGAPQLTSEWTRVDAALDTAKYLSSGEAVFSFDALTNRFFKVIAE